MANSRIVWNANTLDFPGPLDARSSFDRKSLRSLSMSDGKIHSTNRRLTFFEGRMVMQDFDSAGFEAGLVAWWAWAVQGKQYAFARDSGKLYDSTAAAQVSIGDTTVQVASTTGVTVGDWMLLLSAAGLADAHKFLVSALLTTPTRIQFTGYASKYLFPVGAVVRHEHYFPKVVSLDDDYPVVEGLATWSLDHKFREDGA